jgi:hypothetical protein
VSERQTVPPMVHSNINHGEKRMTKGEYRVGIDFNPSGNVVVHQIKRMAADLIDYIEDIAVIDAPGWGEVARLKAEAQTAAENASMWGVKAATKKLRDG